jgi:hypothetical protein
MPQKKTMRRPTAFAFQFSLRSLLCLVAILSVWLAGHVRRVNEQDDAIQIVERLGGLGGFAFYEDDWDAGKNQPADVPLAERASFLNRLGMGHFQNVTAAILEGEELDDRQFSTLIEGFPDLRFLNLRVAVLSKQSLRRLAELRALEVLYVAGTNADDDTLAAVAQLPQLWSLDICSTKVTDAGLMRLTALPKLREIYIEGTAVSEAGFEHLRRSIPRLRRRRY